MDRSANLVWIDLEMTGLNPQTCHIIEIATIITSGDLDVLAEGPCCVIHQPEHVLGTMSDAVREMHTGSGLLERVRSSHTSLTEAAEQTLARIQEFCEEGSAPLCGNSVWKDRQFLERYMPQVERYLHHRIIDVSTIKELVRRWYGPAVPIPDKADHHRALDDVRESIAELRHYRAHAFVSST